MDREKVIKGLEYCTTQYNCRNRASKCPYIDNCSPIDNATGNTLMRDALALLKEQEDMGKELTDAVELVHKKNARIIELTDRLKEQEAKNVVNMTLSKDCFLIASCPKCNALLTRVEHKNYCGYCGQAVKWE